MSIYLSLLRAINVGGNNQVKMAALKELHEATGFRSVRTYLQTGNVIFEGDEQDPTALTADLKTAFQAKLGFPVEIVVRSGAELADLVKRNPFLNQPERESKWILVMFLSEAPSEEAKFGLLTTYAGPEEIVFSGKEVFIYYPEGVGTSRLSNAFIEKKLKTTGTSRNWNTVREILKMTGQPCD